MRESFEYFYPVDLRISGKDLLPNHLAMYIFNHCAIFSDPENWPISINCNGWILVDGEKMSKSAGNFITIESATSNSSIDSLRMALADAGDDLDDANYVRHTGKDTNVLRLFTFVDSIQRFIASKSQVAATLAIMMMMMIYLQSVLWNIMRNLTRFLLNVLE